MKITLVTPCPPDLSAFGVRSLSAYLRANGVDTRVIFLPGGLGRLQEGGSFTYHYPDRAIEDLIELCRDCSLVGLSFMSNYLDISVQLTEAVKSRLGLPVIWGGIHASSKPVQCLDFADIVCVGEGEETLLELARAMQSGRSYIDIQGLVFKHDGQVVENPIRPLVRELDTLPDFDFSNENHYIYSREQGRVVELTDEFFSEALPLLPYFGGRLIKAYRTMTDRGCPHRCTYCNVSYIKALYEGCGVQYFRHRSIERVIEEIVQIKKRFPQIEAVQFFDDTFFARTPGDLVKFAALYKQRVGLPFYCQASPTTLTEDKLKGLIAAGLVYVEMGIQTGSERIRNLYHRQETNEKILQGTRLLHKYGKSLLRPDYHIILDNPWELPEDTMQTVRLLADVPKPFGLCISSLIFFPGTKLYEKAVAEGIVKDETSDIYRRPFYIPPKKTYPNFLIYLLTFQRFPAWLLHLMMRDAVVRFFMRTNPSFLYKFAYMVGEGVRLASKGVEAVATGDFGRIVRYIKKLIVNDPTVEGRKS